MDVTTLILTMAGLLGVLLILVLIYVVSKKPAKQTAKRAKNEAAPRRAPENVRTLEALEKVIFDRSSSKEELSKAAEAIGTHYGKIHATTLARYSRIIMSLCRHPNTDKTIIIGFDRTLRQQNPSMRQELDLALRKGLDSRR